MIVLPKGAFIVKRDEAVVVENKSGLILSQEDLKPKPPNTGVILFTSEELNKYQLCKIVFRENFGEDITIDGVEGDLLFFRDFNSSYYYILKDDKK